MFVYKDDEGTMNLFTESDKVAELVMVQETTMGEGSVPVVAFCTGCATVATATVMRDGLRAMFHHEGDLAFEVAQGQVLPWAVHVSKKVAPF